MSKPDHKGKSAIIRAIFGAIRRAYFSAIVGVILGANFSFVLGFILGAIVGSIIAPRPSVAVIFGAAIFVIIPVVVLVPGFIGSTGVRVGLIVFSVGVFGGIGVVTPR